MQKSGVTLSLLWVEYCEQCRQNGELPYKSTQFNKYYADYVHKTKATMHLEHKPARPCRWTGRARRRRWWTQTTGERLDAYLFVAVAAIQRLRLHGGLSGHEAGGLDYRSCQRLPVFRRGHSHPHADNLKTGVVKNSRTKTVLNKAYQEMAEHYGTAILPARPRSPKDKAFVEGSVGVVSTWILAALRNRQFLSLTELNQAIREKLETFNHKPFQNGRAAGRLVLPRSNSFCSRCQQCPLSWQSGRLPRSSITTTSAWSA